MVLRINMIESMVLIQYDRIYGSMVLFLFFLRVWPIDHPNNQTKNVANATGNTLKSLSGAHPPQRTS